MVKIDPSLLAMLGDKQFPKRAMNATNVFRATEHLTWFLRACSKLGIDDIDLFAPEELLDGSGGFKVLRTLQCLRQKTDRELLLALPLPHIL